MYNYILSHYLQSMNNKNTKISKVTVDNNNQKKSGSRSVSYLVQYRKKLIKNASAISEICKEIENAEQKVQNHNEYKQRIKQELNKKREAEHLHPYFQAFMEDIDNDRIKIQQQCNLEKEKVKSAESNLEKLKIYLQQIKKQYQSNSSRQQLKQQFKKVQTLQAQIKQIKQKQQKQLQPFIKQLKQIEQQEKELQQCWEAIIKQIEQDNKNGFTQQKFNKIMLDLENQQAETRKQIYILEEKSQGLRKYIQNMHIIEKLNEKSHTQFLVAFNQILLYREIKAAQQLVGKVKKIDLTKNRISQENLELKKIQLQFKQNMIKKHRFTIQDLTESIKRQSVQLLNLQFDKHFS